VEDPTDGEQDLVVGFPGELHVHEPGTPWVSLAALFLAASPVVATFHAALDSSFAYDHAQRLGRAGMKRIDVCIAVSEAAREYPASLFPAEYRIIPNGVTVEKYAPAVGAAKTKGRVLFIGRAEKRKGLGVLLHAADEPGVLGQLGQTLGTDLAEHPDGVAAARAPHRLVDAREQVLRGPVPRPAQVHRELLERRESGRELGTDREATRGLPAAEAYGAPRDAPCGPTFPGPIP